MLLDWYERRRVLRPKGWINLRDDEGRTALHMAANVGHVGCVESLLRKEARADIKDFANKQTALDMAKARKKKAVVDIFEEWFAEEEEEELDAEGNVANDGLTSTQRSKLKKKKLQELEGSKASKAKEKRAEDKDTNELDSEMPKPVWPEVKKVVESKEMLRGLSEITVSRTHPESSARACRAAWTLRCGISRASTGSR